MTGRKITTASWEDLEKGLRATKLLSGLIVESEGIQSITFHAPGGDALTVPRNSTLEIEFGQTEDLYAIGIRVGDSYALTHGPSPSLLDLLAIPPPTPNARILRLLHGKEAQIETHQPCGAPCGEWLPIGEEEVTA